MIKITPQETTEIIRLFDQAIFDLKYGNLNREIDGLILNINKMTNMLKTKYVESELEELNENYPLVVLEKSDSSESPKEMNS